MNQSNGIVIEPDIGDIFVILHLFETQLQKECDVKLTKKEVIQLYSALHDILNGSR